MVLCKSFIRFFSLAAEQGERQDAGPSTVYKFHSRSATATLSSCTPTDHQELCRPIYIGRVSECYISSVSA
jgi:hypothetical protein